MLNIIFSRQNSQIRQDFKKGARKQACFEILLKGPRHLLTSIDVLLNADSKSHHMT